MTFYPLNFSTWDKKENLALKKVKSNFYDGFKSKRV